MSAAAEKAKTNKSARQKAQVVLNRYLAEPGDGSQYRDPAAQAKKEDSGG